MPEIKALWLEFEENQSKEARFVKILDKYDSLLQAKDYAENYDMNKMYDEFELAYSDMCKEISNLNI